MIQYIRFATHDPEGFALIRLDSITGIASTIHPDQCRVITPHGEYLCAGTFEHFNELFNSFVGGSWDGVPSTEANDGT